MSLLIDYYGTAEMRILRWMYGVTGRMIIMIMEMIKSEYIRGSLKVAAVNDKLKSISVLWA